MRNTVDFHSRSKDPNHSPLSVSQSKEASKGERERERDERHSRVDFIDMQIECDRESFSFLASHPSFHSSFSLFQNHSNESLGLLQSIFCRKKRCREEAMERKDEMKRAKDTAKIDKKKRLIRKLVLVCLVCHLFLFSSFCLSIFLMFSGNGCISAGDLLVFFFVDLFSLLIHLKMLSLGMKQKEGSDKKTSKTECSISRKASPIRRTKNSKKRAEWRWRRRVLLSSESEETSSSSHINRKNTRNRKRKETEIDRRRIPLKAVSRVLSSLTSCLKKELGIRSLVSFKTKECNLSTSVDHSQRREWDRKQWKEESKKRKREREKKAAQVLSSRIVFTLVFLSSLVFGFLLTPSSPTKLHGRRGRTRHHFDYRM